MMQESYKCIQGWIDEETLNNPVRSWSTFGLDPIALTLLKNHSIGKPSFAECGQVLDDFPWEVYRIDGMYYRLNSVAARIMQEAHRSGNRVEKPFWFRLVRMND